MRKYLLGFYSSIGKEALKWKYKAASKVLSDFIDGQGGGSFVNGAHIKRVSDGASIIEPTRVIEEVGVSRRRESFAREEE